MEKMLAMLQSRPADPPPSGSLAVDDVIDGWRVVAYLGEGASGEVYHVQKEKSGNDAALKLCTHTDFNKRQRFDEEQTVLSTLSPSISALPGFYGTGCHHGQPYYLMEYLSAIDLPMAPERIARFMIEVAEAVHQLHCHSYIHRDLKPDNLMLRANGEVVLIDLGLVKPLIDDNPSGVGRKISLVNGHRVGVGTVGFASPEQLNEGICSVAGDVYSLGKIAKACFGPQRKPPHHWRVIIRKAVNGEPSDRYHTAKEFASAVRSRLLPYQLAAAIAATALLALSTIFMTASNRQPHSMQITKHPPVVVAPSPPPIPPAISNTDPTDLERDENETYIEYFDRLTPLAENGDPVAQRHLAELYYHGHGTARDYNRAADLYRRSALQGDPDAMDSFGHCLFNGRGVAVNRADAVVWFRAAANLNHPSGACNLGYCLLHGLGVEANREEGLRLIAYAADRGLVRAQNLLKQQPTK